MRQDFYDVVVVGGGLVGACTALGLQQQGRRVALVDPGLPDFAALEQGWDARIYAISPGNRRFLESLGAWPDDSRIGVVECMDVHGDRGGRLGFAASDVGAPALAYIVENRWLLAALWRRLREQPLAVFETPALALRRDAREARLSLEDGTELHSQLLVGADGASSWVRTQAAIGVNVKPYAQSAVVANFSCERGHDNTARQWFLGDGILAWLPMPGNCISIVWSSPSPGDLLALDGEALCERVAAAGGAALGRLHLLAPASAFPLRLLRPDALVSGRLALAGDAGHTVHPLAGQGVNLGFQDAATLTALLAAGGDAGDWMRLRRYERSRREAIVTMQTACDGLYTLFNRQDLPGLAWLRNAGLSLTDRLPGLKRQFARHAIGY
ncbi:UbiH/UbiF family hydroxylase [Paludibacterium yongneupense]|uniref:UbiH/UbiF family hydroxylase n=1 Tax=Paludibacterium yongneupense TaxID=400061 RepID=UPI0004096E24|nr:UbiH/UbiF family hydroxylase [Paludibacterium yongneupense]